MIWIFKITYPLREHHSLVARTLRRVEDIDECFKFGAASIEID